MRTQLLLAGSVALVCLCGVPQCWWEFEAAPRAVSADDSPALPLDLAAAGLENSTAGVLAASADPRQGRARAANASSLEDILDTSKLMPFYLIPISGCFVTLVTVGVLGVSIKLDHPRDRAAIVKLKAMGQWVFNVVLVGLAINGYREDLKRVMSANAAGFFEYLSVLLVVCATSSNLKNSLAAWTAFASQAPTALFFVTPKYTVVWGSFPLVPWATRWLSAAKWVYLALLAPYLGLLVLLMASSMCIVLCQALGGCLVFIWNEVSVELWLMAVVFTFGQCSHARAELAYYWLQSWPLYWLVALQAEPFLVTEVASALYEKCLCSAWATTYSQVGRWERSEPTLLWRGQEHLQADFQEGDRYAGLDVQEKSQRLLGRESESNAKHALPTDDEVGALPPDVKQMLIRHFLSIKVTIVSFTLKGQAGIMFVQFLGGFLGRALLSEGAPGIIEAARTTVTERHIWTYMATLEHAAVSLFAAAMGEFRHGFHMPALPALNKIWELI